MERYKNLVMICLIFIVISLVIFFSKGPNLFWPLYYVPVLLAAVYYNEIGGALTGLAAALCLFAFVGIFPIGGEATGGMVIEFSVASGIIISTGFLFGWLFRTQKKRIADLSDGSMLDRLTGLHNYGYFAERLEEERKRADRFGSRLAMIMIDVDYFKPFNDKFGHASGNLLLKKISGLIEECVRDVDVVCRYGGEEFAVILPNTEQEALAVAERIRDAVESDNFEGNKDEPVVKKTVSIGVAVYPNACDNELELIDCADKALDRAKETGRNKVVQFDSKADSTA